MSVFLQVTVSALLVIRVTYSSTFAPTPEPTPFCYQGFREGSLKFSSSATKTAIDITLQFQTTCDLIASEQITVSMPFFTIGNANTTSRGSDVPFGELIISPSLQFQASWIEGSYNYSVPFNHSKLLLMLRHGQKVLQLTTIKLNISSDNGIKAFSGFPAWDSIISAHPLPEFIISTNKSELYEKHLLQHPQMGNGCSQFFDCSGYGRCDYAKEICICNDGHGSPNDIIMPGHALDGSCRERASQCST